MGCRVVPFDLVARQCTAADGYKRTAISNSSMCVRLLQVVDDILDFTSRQSFLGKPALGDVKTGVITCPVLFAAEEHPELVPMIKRKFKCAGDIEHAVHCVQRSSAIDRSRDLANDFVHQALACVDELGPCPSEHAKQARDALRGVCEKVRLRMNG